jgi:polyisoprenyl-phosphate glycosyltransferase
MKISIIIPCFNEEDVVLYTYERLYKVLTSINYEYELVFINDGSADTTLEKLLSLQKKNDKVKVISFSRNFGHQASVSAGLHHAKGDAVVIIDADLQDPPELIPEMIKKWISGVDVVYGVRSIRKGESMFKKLSANIYYRFINFLSDVYLPIDTGDFRLIDRKVIDAFNTLPERNKYIRGIISWLGFKQEPLFFERDARFAGETKYPFSKMIKFAFMGLTYFSDKPLRLALNLGFISTLIGLIYGAIVIIQKIFLPHLIVSGWPSTLVTIIFLGGVQLICLGFIGLYLGKIFDEVKGRPQYIVEKSWGIDCCSVN